MLIGLATPFLTNNYGTKLQAFALQQIISYLGYESEIINYRFGQKIYSPKKLLLSNRRTYKIMQKDRTAALKNNKKIKTGYEIRKSAFENFTKNKYRFSERCETLKEAKKIAKKYTAVICGSDQVWLPSHVLAKYYMLDFVPKGVKRVAYAPSFGISHIPQYLKNDYKKHLMKFDVITARENIGAELVKEITGTDCAVVADPTLLLTKEQWEKLLGEESNHLEEKYVFAYFIGANEKHRKMAKEYAESRGYRVILLPHIGEIVDADEKYADIAPYDISPVDFVNLIKNAETVFTDSFHGTVFSLIFQKNFYCFERFEKNNVNSTNSRIYSLLQTMNLEERLVNLEEQDSLENENDISYETVYQCIERLREQSIDILKRTLDNYEH